MKNVECLLEWAELLTDHVLRYPKATPATDSLCMVDLGLGQRSSCAMFPQIRVVPV